MNPDESAPFAVTFIERPAHLFKSSEVFVSTAEIDPAQRSMAWSVPAALRSGFEPFARAEAVLDPHDPATVAAFAAWFRETLGLPEEALAVDTSTYYVSAEHPQVINRNVRYNQTDSTDIEGDDSITSEYLDTDQKCAAYILGGRVVSVAFDNGTGSVTVATLPDFRNRGYATACLQRLIGEYRSEETELGYGTTLGNAAAVRVAEKCGMKNTSYGYWVRVDASWGEDLREDRPELFR